MIIPFSSRRVRRDRAAPSADGESNRPPYMHTALAAQLLPDDDDRREGRMGFLDHLDELRSRLIRASVAVAARMVIAFVFIERIVTFMRAPTRRMWSQRC
jgi:Sec-independent protein translocase protein (TatC)